MTADWKAGLVEHVPGEFRDLPQGIVRRGVHAPRPAKATGLDWSALTTRCSVCGEASMDVDRTSMCPRCRGAFPPPAEPAPVVVKKPRQPSIAVRNQDDIVRRYTAGEASTAIAASYGCSAGSVLNLLRALDVPVRGRGGHPRTGGAA